MKKEFFNELAQKYATDKTAALVAQFKQMNQSQQSAALHNLRRRAEEQKNQDAAAAWYACMYEVSNTETVTTSDMKIKGFE